MPFEQRYFAEHRLILMRVFDTVTLDDSREITRCLQNTLDQLAVETDMFLDLHAITKFPTSISQLREAMHTVESPNLGWIVLLTGDNAMLKFVASIMVQLKTHGARFRVFERPESAISFLQGLQPAARERSQWLVELRKSLT